nr:hypothetical protein [Actinomycetes bacterium]
MAIVESKSGTRIAGLEAPDANLPRFMQALHYVLAKREDPTVSFDACGDMGPADFESLLGRLGAPKD